MTNSPTVVIQSASDTSGGPPRGGRSTPSPGGRNEQLSAYTRPNLQRSVLALATSVVPFLGLWVLMLLWMKGFPDRARERALEGIQLAERLHHPQSIAYAHFHAGLIHIWRREPERAREHAHAVLELADTHEFPVWAAAGACLHGAAIAASGSVDDGLARFEVAIEQYRALQMPPVFWPALLQLNAGMLGLAGRPAEGVACVSEALDVIAELPEPQMMSSELLLLKGTLVLADANDAAEAEVWIERAVQRADELEAPMLQLRARMRVIGLIP